MGGTRNNIGLALVLGVLVSVIACLAFYVHSNTTSIRDALTAEVLQQQSAVANLLYEYDRLIVALETQRLSGGSEEREPVIDALLRTEDQLEAMRFKYSFERLDGASTAHAYIKPVLEDVRQWLSTGVPGVTSEPQEMIKVSSSRVLERHANLREIMEETNQVADELINTQTSYLTRFGKSLMFLLAAFAMLVTGIIALLTVQRDLQSQLADDQQRHAQRIKDFADTGADWFWEMNNDMRLRWLSGRTLSREDSFVRNEGNRLRSRNANNSNENGLLPLYGHGINHNDWPLEQLNNRVSFYDYETQWTTRDGEVKTVAVSGVPLFNRKGKFEGYRGIGRDITPRKQIEYELEVANRELLDAEKRGREQAEQALRDSEIFLRTSLNALPQSLAILSDNGVILEANTAWREYTKATDRQAVAGNTGEGSVIGLHYNAFFQEHSTNDPSSMLEVSQHIDAVLKGYSGNLRTEVMLSNNDQTQWLAIALSPFYSNEIRYCVLAVEEVTERKQLEEKDRQLHAELAHFSRLTTVGELATGLAHELNQPLTAISHNCDALLSGIETSSPFDASDVEAIHAIHNEANRAGAIIKGLRKMVRKETGGFSATDLNRLITETVRLGILDANKHGINVSLHLAADLPHPEIDAVQIQQVLVNLERNGVDAIRASNCAIREMVISTALEPNGCIRVTVQDSGGGFAPEVREALFSPFLTTKKNGMGMGLSISRSIIESHGGQLWVDFEHQSMTTFHFRLPVDHTKIEHETGFLPGRAII